MWHVTHDMWHVKCDIWHVTCVVWCLTLLFFFFTNNNDKYKCKIPASEVTELSNDSDDIFVFLVAQPSGDHSVKIW